MAVPSPRTRVTVSWYPCWTAPRTPSGAFTTHENRGTFSSVTIW